jgi:hypothetical protein
MTSLKTKEASNTMPPPPRPIDLDDVLLGQQVFIDWWQLCRDSVAALLRRDPTVTPDRLPEERAEVLADGTLRIYADVPGSGRLALEVPAGEWCENK